MIRIEVMTPEPPRRSDFTAALAALAAVAVLAVAAASFRLAEYLAYLDSTVV